MARFSKSAMIRHLEVKADRIAEQWGFDRNNGTAQLRGKTGEAHVAYGEFNLCQTLLDDLADGRLDGQ